jgi:tRNA A22 N-methylase
MSHLLEDSHRIYMIHNCHILPKYTCLNNSNEIQLTRHLGNNEHDQIMKEKIKQKKNKCVIHIKNKHGRNRWKNNLTSQLVHKSLMIDLKSITFPKQPPYLQVQT